MDKLGKWIFLIVLLLCGTVLTAVTHNGEYFAFSLLAVVGLTFFCLMTEE